MEDFCCLSLNLRSFIDINEDSLLHIRSNAELSCLLNCRRIIFKMDVLLNQYPSLLQRYTKLKSCRQTITASKESSECRESTPFLGALINLIGKPRGCLTTDSWQFKVLIVSTPFPLRNVWLHYETAKQC